MFIADGRIHKGFYDLSHSNFRCYLTKKHFPLHDIVCWIQYHNACHKNKNEIWIEMDVGSAFCHDHHIPPYSQTISVMTATGDIGCLVTKPVRSSRIKSIQQNLPCSWNFHSWIYIIYTCHVNLDPMDLLNLTCHVNLHWIYTIYTCPWIK